MKHSQRLKAIETALTAKPMRGFRYYSTNDDLEAAGVFIDCNDEPVGYRAARAPSCETIKSVDDLNEAQRANIVGRERIEQDEAAGFQVFIVRYTAKVFGAPADAGFVAF